MSKYVFNCSQYKKQINKKNYFSFTIIFLAIILLLGACVFLRPKNLQFLELYFIQTGEFQNYQQALNHSQDISSNGGAGYIYFDNNYHVIASFYSNYDDAKSVLNKIKNDYPSAKIFTIKTKKFSNQTDLNNKQNNCMKNYANKSEDFILKLEMFCSKFFTNSISFNELSIHFKNLKKDFDEVCDDFITSFKTVSKHNLAKEYVIEMSNSMERLVDFNEQELTYRFRYEIVNLVIQRHQLLSCF